MSTIFDVGQIRRQEEHKSPFLNSKFPVLTLGSHATSLNPSVVQTVGGGGERKEARNFKGNLRRAESGTQVAHVPIPTDAGRGGRLPHSRFGHERAATAKEGEFGVA